MHSSSVCGWSLLALLLSGAGLAAQQALVPSELSDQEKEQFLLHAEIVDVWVQLGNVRRVD